MVNRGLFYQSSIGKKDNSHTNCVYISIHCIYIFIHIHRFLCRTSKHICKYMCIYIYIISYIISSIMPYHISMA